jgi:hypothetical protein
VSVEVLDARGGQLFSAALVAPTASSPSPPTNPGELVHDLTTSYSIVLPGEHIVPGMQIALRYARGDVAETAVHAIDVGAPTVLRLTMFDFDYFRTRGDRILSDEVNEEIGWKLPVRELRVQRVDTLLDRAVIAPHEQTVEGVVHRTPWIAATSFEDWAASAQAATGVAWAARNDRSVDHSQMLLGALLAAGGQAYIVGMHGNFNDGTMGNFKGRGGSNMLSSSTTRTCSTRETSSSTSSATPSISGTGTKEPGPTIHTGARCSASRTRPMACIAGRSGDGDHRRPAMDRGARSWRPT